MQNRPRADGGRDNLLDFVDQALFLGLRATGQAAVTQIVWVYEHEIDMQGVGAFHLDMGYGMAGRLIEPSILPFGRHRWVTSTGPAAPAGSRREGSASCRATSTDSAISTRGVEHDSRDRAGHATAYDGL